MSTEISKRKANSVCHGECPEAPDDPSGSSFNLAVQRPSCFRFMSIWGKRAITGDLLGLTMKGQGEDATWRDGAGSRGEQFEDGTLDLHSG